MLWESSYRRNECWNIWWITPLYERFNLWGLDEWGFSTYGMLWQIMEPHIATTIELCDLYKKIWDFIARSFLRQSNVSSVNEKFFTTDQFGKWLPKYYNTKKINGILYCSINLLLLIGTTKASLGKLRDCFFAIWLRLWPTCVQRSNPC